jgi:hypothetical protein
MGKGRLEAQKGAGAEVSSRPLRALASVRGESRNREQRVTGKEKRRRWGWPRHPTSFPPDKTPQSREGEADLARLGANVGLLHLARRHPGDCRTCEMETGLGSDAAIPLPRPLARILAQIAAGPPSERALEGGGGTTPALGLPAGARAECGWEQTFRQQATKRPRPKAGGLVLREQSWWPELDSQDSGPRSAHVVPHLGGRPPLMPSPALLGLPGLDRVISAGGRRVAASWSLAM